MFISKAEKHNLYKLIADLQLRVNKVETELMEKPKQDVSKRDEEYAAYKKAYAQKYYWRKKAENLANKAKNTINQGKNTINLAAPKKQETKA